MLPLLHFITLSLTLLGHFNIITIRFYQRTLNMSFLQKLHNALQRRIRTLLFKGRHELWAERVSYGIENLFLMLVLFYLLLNTLLYNWTGALYSEGTGFRLDWVFGGLDNLIPFVPEMALVYVHLFYAFTILSMFYFAFIAGRKGYALGWTLVIVHTIAIIIYIVFPVSTYWYRAELLAAPLQNNPWAEVMYGYYASDTSFNCFPSLHAAVSAAIAYAWCSCAKSEPHVVRTIAAAAAVVIASAVVLSTLFVRQHYIIDEIAGVLLAVFVARYIFRRL
jgi:membrane-associated phospholipid phosphatase